MRSRMKCSVKDISLMGESLSIKFHRKGCNNSTIINDTMEQFLIELSVPSVLYFGF